jgi:hypothetical protein
MREDRMCEEGMERRWEVVLGAGCWVLGGGGVSLCGLEVPELVHKTIELVFEILSVASDNDNRSVSLSV